jgi:hypothetical protein
MKVTPSAQGGVVSEPLYWRMSDEEILASTSVKSMPPGIAVFVPGVLMAEMLEESDLMIEEDSPVETWNMRATTASLVGSAEDVLMGLSRRMISNVLTDTLVHHVDLERVVFAVDVVLRWCMHVKLDELEI